MLKSGSMVVVTFCGPSDRIPYRHGKVIIEGQEVICRATGNRKLKALDGRGLWRCKSGIYWQNGKHFMEVNPQQELTPAERGQVRQGKLPIYNVDDLLVQPKEEVPVTISKKTKPRVKRPRHKSPMKRFKYPKLSRA